MLVGDKIIWPIHSFIMRYKRASRDRKTPLHTYLYILENSAFFCDNLLTLFKKGGRYFYVLSNFTSSL